MHMEQVGADGIKDLQKVILIISLQLVDCAKFICEDVCVLK